VVRLKLRTLLRRSPREENEADQVARKKAAGEVRGSRSSMRRWNIKNVWGRHMGGVEDIG